MTVEAEVEEAKQSEKTESDVIAHVPTQKKDDKKSKKEKDKKGKKQKGIFTPHTEYHKLPWL